MLGRLLKYEIKATARWFLPLYGALALTALAGRLFLGFQLGFGDWGGSITNIFMGLLVALFFGLLVALGVVSVIIMIQRFYKNLLGDEGYLMFTLPVPPVNNMNCKLIVSVMWSAISALLVLLIGFAFIASLWHIPDVKDACREIGRGFIWLFDELGVSSALLVAEMLFASLISLACGILQVYVSIALGHLANRHKILISFAAYIGISWATSLVSNIVMFALGVAGNRNWWMRLEAHETFQLFLWTSLGIQLLFGVAYYVGTSLILTKRLNLE